MTTVLDRVAATVGAHDLNLHKASPRGHDHLLLVLTRPDRSKVAGQWFSDRARATTVALQTQAHTGGSVDVPVLADSGVLLQPDGADRMLRALHRLASAPGATLVAHRAERRGTVRLVGHGDQVTYTKIVRPERFTAMAARTPVRIPDVAVPLLVGTDPDAGTMTCTALPGQTLQQLLDDPSVPTRDIIVAGHKIGEAVARLHASPAPPTAGHHDAAAEVAVTCGWLQRAHTYGLLDSESAPVRETLDTASRLLAEPACDPTYLHRDLHDLQLVIDDHGDVGILDFDLSTTGEPALDLANLLVHLELKALIGNCSPDRAGACAQAVLDGYAPSGQTWRRVPAYALATRLRLASVFAFRPRNHDVALGLLTGTPKGPLREHKER